MKKKCCKCKRNKDLSEFSKCSNAKDGLNYSCKKCNSDTYYENKERRAEAKRKSAKKYYKNNQDKLKKYREENKQKKAEYDKEYRKRNAKKIAQQKKEWEDRNRQKIDFKLVRNLRRRIHHALFNNVKSDHSIKLLGCSIEEYKTYLESLFQDGMTWENYGVSGWHIDHIKPCHEFDLSIESQQYECFNYKNTRPLWAKDNLTRLKPNFSKRKTYS